MLTERPGMTEAKTTEWNQNLLVWRKKKPSAEQTLHFFLKQNQFKKRLMNQMSRFPAASCSGYLC